MSRLKVAFLYSEIAGYFMANIRVLAEEADVLIFRWPVNEEAPFHFEEIEGVEVLGRSKFTDDQIHAKLKAFNPEAIVCSGWMDKGYLKVAKRFKKQIPVIVSLDNHWRGDVKQRIAQLAAPFTLQRIFTHAWVPGKPQFDYALKLGFKKERILENFYVADVNHFTQLYEESYPSKEKSFPKRILYVGRYVEHKGIFEMWNAFQELRNEENLDWELWCLGTGDQWESRVEADGISHFGFVQASEMMTYLQQTSIYILPSKFEPWGVTVQEFAVSGFPIIASTEVGATTKYVNKTNGVIVADVTKENLKQAITEMTSKTPEQLLSMGKASHELGTKITNQTWSETLINVIK